MRAKNKVDAPKWHIHWVHVFLVAIHLVVFFHAASLMPIVTTKVATRALP
jgi:hypothetical protein